MSPMCEHVHCMPVSFSVRTLKSTYIADALCRNVYGGDDVTKQPDVKHVDIAFPALLQTAWVANPGISHIRLYVVESTSLLPLYETVRAPTTTEFCYT